jgi:hypothetical protein
MVDSDPGFPATSAVLTLAVVVLLTNMLEVQRRGGDLLVPTDPPTNAGYAGSSNLTPRSRDSHNARIRRTATP